MLGQYDGYGDEEGVKDGSRTDTYAAMRVEVDSRRWAGVPCYLRTGKRLTAKQAEIAVAFRPSPHIPFVVGRRLGRGTGRSSASSREHVQLHVTGKRPGAGLELVRSSWTSTPARTPSATPPRPTSASSATPSRTTARCSPPAPRSRRSGRPSRRCCAIARTPSPHAPGSAGPEEAEELLAAMGGGGVRFASASARALRRPVVLLPAGDHARGGAVDARGARRPARAHAAVRGRLLRARRRAPGGDRRRHHRRRRDRRRTASSRCGRRSTCRSTRPRAATGSPGCASPSCSRRCCGWGSSRCWRCRRARWPGATAGKARSRRPRC